MDSRRTTTRQYSEYSDFVSTQREREYDHDTDLPRRESTLIRWDGRDGRRELDSGMGHTQDYRTRWTDDDWTFTQSTEQPASRKRRAGCRPAVNRIPEETVVHRDSRWDIPWKRALFTSNGPDSTTSGSDIPEGYADRPPGEEYSDIPTSGRPHVGYVAEGLCSPIRQLEKAVVRLQQDIADYCAELKLSKTHTPAVSTRYWDSVQTTVEAPAPTPEVPAVEKLLQRLVTDTQSRPLPVVNPPAPTELEQSMRPFLAEQRRRRRQPCSGQVVTATGDGDTELSPSGCESSSTNKIRTVDVLVHRGTAPATATATATATRPAGLERCVMFLLWEVM